MTKVVPFPDQRRIAEEAAEWLIRLDSERPPARSELQALGAWLAQSPAHREELRRLASLWNRMNILTELSVPLTKASARSPRRSLGGAARRGPARRWRYAALGMMVMSATITAALFLTGDDAPPAVAENHVYETGVGQQSTVVLPDGSSVILNTSSRINVNYDSRYRNVYLSQGEALFSVAKLANVPFRVYAGSERVEALGTAFSVRLDHQFVKVIVTEGRVSLASAATSQPENADPAARAGSHPAVPGPAPRAHSGDAFRPVGRLGAGEAATIYANAEPNTIAEPAVSAIESFTSAELERQLAWSDGILLFSGDTLGSVAKEVSRYTTLRIEIPDAELRNLRVGGRLPIGETEAMLAALEANFNIEVLRPNRERVILTAVTD